MAKEEGKKREKRANGEGTYGVTKTGKISLKRMVGYLPNGKPKYLTVSGTSKNMCKKLMDAKVSRYLNKSLNEDIVKKMSFLELCESFQDEDKKKTGKQKSATIKRNGCTIRNQIKGYYIASIQVISVRPDDIEEHIRTLLANGYSISTVEKAFYIINKTLRWAKNKKFIAENPCDEVKEDILRWLSNIEEKQKSVRTKKVLSRNEIEVIISKVNSRKYESVDRYIFALSILVLLYTGMRVGELCALRWDKWSRKYKKLSILWTVARKEKEEGEDGTTKIENEVKNTHSRHIILNDEAERALEEIYRITPLKGDKDYISLNEVYKSTCSSDFDAKIKTFYRDCGFPDSISGAHILRATCATEMYRNGCRVEDIAAYLGDTVETIMKSYIEVTEKIEAEGEVINVVEYPRSNLR